MAYSKRILKHMIKHLFWRKGIFYAEVASGIGFFINRNMFAAIESNCVILRTSEKAAKRIAKDKHAMQMIPNKGFLKDTLIIEYEGVKDVKKMKKWIDESIEYISTLPPND